MFKRDHSQDWLVYGELLRQAGAYVTSHRHADNWTLSGVKHARRVDVVRDGWGIRMVCSEAKGEVYLPVFVPRKNAFDWLAEAPE